MWKAQEIGWNRYVPNRSAAARRVSSYIEDDMIGHGDIVEVPCQLPPDIRCTIAVASSSDGKIDFLSCKQQKFVTSSAYVILRQTFPVYVISD